MKIYTSYIHSPVGSLRISCTEHFLTDVSFTGNEAPGVNEDHALLSHCTLQLQEYFSGTRRTFDLPLDQTGTEFQRKVWTLLCEIPYGKTVSYHQLAKNYGDVKAIRACASANGKNHLAIIVPCHRVIGSDQKLVGYAGGLYRKKWLLEHEAKHSGVPMLF